MTTASHNDPFRALLDVGAALVSSPILDEALQNVAAAIGAALQVATVDIQSFDRARGCLVEEAYWSFAGVSDADRAVLGTTIPLDEHPTATRVLGEGVVVELRADDPDLDADGRAALASWGLTTTLDGPLLIGDEAIGILGVAESRFPRRFLSMEVELFEQLSGMAATAMRNARLFKRDEEHSRHLEALLEISHRTASDPDPQATMDAAAVALVDVLGADHAGVYELDRRSARPIPRAARPAGAVADGDRAELAAAITAELLADARAGDHDDGKPLFSLICREFDEVAAGVEHIMAGLGETTLLTVAIHRHGAPIAALTASWPTAHDLDAAQLELARAIGDQIGIAVENDRILRG